MSSTASIANNSFLLSRSTGSAARGAEAVGSARALGERRNGRPGDARDRRQHELSNSLAAGECHGLGAEIGEDHPDLAAVVRVDGAGAVEHGETVLERKARARPDLRF